MEARELKVDDVVQISPELKDCFFPGCFMQISEPKSWGAQGVILLPKSRDEKPLPAYFRCNFTDMEFVGRAPWVTASEEEE